MEDELNILHGDIKTLVTNVKLEWKLGWWLPKCKSSLGLMLHIWESETSGLESEDSMGHIGRFYKKIIAR